MLSIKTKTIVTSKTSSSNSLIYALVLAIGAFLLNSQSLGHGFTMDDPLVITSNKLVQKGTSAISEIWGSSYLEGYNGVTDAAYRPISITQFAIGKSIFGGSSNSMHFWQVLFYAIGVFLCYLFSFQLFNKNKWLALGTTILFLAHPIHTEVVNNLKSRDEIMMLIGTFGMGFFYLKFLEKEKVQLLIASLFMYFIALFSKETSVSYFLLIPILHYWNKNKWDNKAVVYGAYFLGMALFYLAVRTAIVGGYDIELDIMNNALVAQGGFFNRLPDAFMLLGKYIVMLVWPYPLSVDYSFNSIPMSSWSNPYGYAGMAAVIALIFAFYKSWKKKTFYFVPIAWFFVTIIVASNIFLLIGSTFAERFLFLPSFAFCAVLTYGLYSILKEKRSVFLGIISVIGITYSAWTYQRSSHWNSDLTLFNRDVQFQENNARVQTFYGKFTYEEAKKKKGKEAEDLYNEAEIALEKAIAITPDYMVSNYYHGFINKQQKEYGKAAISFRKAMELDTTFKSAQIQYAIASANNNDHSSAIKQLQKLRDSGDNSFLVVYNKAYSHLKLKQYDEALKLFIEAHTIDPNNKGTLSNIIKIYRDVYKDMPSAIKYNDKLKKIK